jgi:glycosyltransferase involved in cell wall biosynthesis
MGDKAQMPPRESPSSRQLDCSVIVPVFQRHDVVLRAVRSVLAQTVAPREILVVDDGSDPPIDLAPLAPLPPCIRILRHERRRGAAAARNTGIRAAAAPILAFLDSDDTWCASKLERQPTLLSSRDDELVALATGFTLTDLVNRTRRRLIPRAVERAEDRTLFVGGCWYSPGSTLMIRAGAFDRVGLFDESLARLEDYDWFLRFAHAGGRLRVVPQVLACINVGVRPDAARLAAAAAALRAKYGPSDHSAVITELATERCFKAALCLYEASGLWYEGRALAAAMLVSKSLWLHRRTSLALFDYFTPAGDSKPGGDGG